jgi:hypothetical protein
LFTLASPVSFVVILSLYLQYLAAGAAGDYVGFFGTSAFFLFFLSFFPCFLSFFSHFPFFRSPISSGGATYYPAAPWNVGSVTGTNKVDLYHCLNNTWSTLSLPSTRFFVSAVGLNNKIYIAGSLFVVCCCS